jgi:enterochelin esterase-like enzyme
VHFGIGHWELFGAVGAHSPSVFYSDAEQMRTWLDSIPVEKMPRIFVDIGDRDRPEIMRVTLWFEAVLNEKDIPHEWYLFTGYHAEEYWSAHIEQYLRWYAEFW